MKTEILDKQRLKTQILDMGKYRRKMSRVVGIGIGHTSSGSNISHDSETWCRRAQTKGMGPCVAYVSIGTPLLGHLRSPTSLGIRH